MMMKQLIVILSLLFLITPVIGLSFTPWVAESDYWKAWNDTHVAIKFNATGNHTFVATGNVTSIMSLVVSAGGSGGGTTSSTTGGGGGGAGGLIDNATPYSVTGVYTIAVGVGSAGSAGGSGTNGTFSAIQNGTFSLAPVPGGGGGGYTGSSTAAKAGGSGGGASGNAAGASGVPGQGSGGGSNAASSSGGGGGGRGGVGGAGNSTAAGNGGYGYTSGIMLGLSCMAGGGAGGTASGDTSATAPCGGGIANTAAAVDTGGGGGGETNGGTGGTGGNGVVILVFEIPPGTFPNASFTSNLTTAAIGQNIQFNDTSAYYPTAWNWSFGDGSAFNLTQNPIHSYSAMGTYPVCLNASNLYGFNTSCSNIAVINATAYTSQDIWMEGEYLQTFVVTDTTTDMPINNVTVTDSDGDTTTTTSNGTAWLTEPFGAYTVLFSASGYDAKTVAYVFDSNATHYVELSPSSTDTNYTGPDVTTYPKYVTFHIKEGFGNPLQDVNVSILAVSTSTGNWDWVLTLLGIPLDEVAVNGTEMYQTTDSMGTATFYVIPTAKYNITFTKAGYTISSMVLVPQDDDYIIWAEGTGATYYEHDYDEVAMVNITVKTVIINDTHAFINLSYNDTLAHTTGGFINVTQKNASPWGAPVTVASFPAVSSSFTNSTIVSHTGQVSGSVACNVSHTDFGQVERSSPWSLKGEAVHFLGFGSDIALLVALGIMMLTVMLAGAVHARHTVVAMAFEGWIFYAIDWFAALEARGISETVILLALTLLTILGFIAHFEVRKRKEKY